MFSWLKPKKAVKTEKASNSADECLSESEGLHTGVENTSRKVLVPYSADRLGHSEIESKIDTLRRTNKERNRRRSIPRSFETAVDRPLKPSEISVFTSYDGESSFEQYIAVFNETLSALGLSSAHGYMILPLKLTKRVRRVYEQLDKDLIFDYQSLLDALKAGLNTDATRLIAQHSLHSKMRDDEKLYEFATRVKTTVDKAFPEFNSPHRELLYVNTFSAGLPSRLQEKIGLKKFNSISEILDYAEHTQTFFKLTGDNLEKKIDEMTEALKVNFLGSDMNQSGNFDQFEEYNQNHEMNYGMNDGNEWNDFATRNGNRGKGRGRYGKYRNRKYENNGYSNDEQNDHHDWNAADYSNEYHPGNVDQQYYQNDSNIDGGMNNDPNYQNHGIQSSGNDGNRNGHFPQINTLFLIVCLVATLIPGVQPTYFKCNQNNTPVALLYIPRPDFAPTCNRNFRDTESVEITVQVFKNNSPRERFAGFACSRIVSKTSFQGRLNVQVEVKTEEFPVSIELCREMEKSKKSPIGKLVNTVENQWTNPSKNGTIDVFAQEALEQEHYLLQYGTIATFGAHFMISNLGNLNECQTKDGVCTNLNRTICWNNKEVFSDCPQLIGNFQALVHEEIVLIESLEMALQPQNHLKRYDSCLKRKSMRMTNDVSLVFPNFPDAVALIDIINSSKTTTRNARVATGERMNLNSKNRFICELQNQRIALLSVEMKVDPTSAIQKILGRPDINATKITEDTFEITLCEPKNVDEVFQNNVYNSTCFEKTPVRVEGTIMFVDHTYLLSKTSGVKTETPCVPQHSDITRRELEQPTLDLAFRPQVEKINERENTSSIGVISLLSFGVNSVEEYKGSIPTWNEITKTISSLGDKAIQFAKEGSSKVVSIGTSIKQEVHETLTWWHSWMRAIAIWTIVIILTVVIAFFTCKFYCMKKFASCINPIRYISTPLRSPATPRKVNVIEQIDPNEYYRNLQEVNSAQDRQQLLQYHARRVNIAPTIPFLTCSLAIICSVIPAAEARTQEIEMTSEYLIHGVIIFSILLIIFFNSRERVKTTDNDKVLRGQEILLVQVVKECSHFEHTPSWVASPQMAYPIPAAQAAKTALESCEEIDRTCGSCA